MRRWLASRPMQQPRAGAGIAEVEHVGGLGEAADAAALRRASVPSPVARRRSAPSARIAAAVRSTSSPSSSPSIAVSPTASAPSISARCEIDLSPGTRATPDRAPVGRDRSGCKEPPKQGGWRSSGGSLAHPARPRTADPAAEFRPRRARINVLTGAGRRGKRLPFRHRLFRQENRRGQTGMGNEAHVPELRGAFLRPAEGSDHLPEMRHRL